MNELIDLATLATLGQHFSSHEDVAELKASMASVQNDLAVIKTFLMHQYGSDFPSTLRMEDFSVEQKMPVAVKQAVSLAQPQNATKEINNASGRAHRKPPPLQRFSRVNSNDQIIGHLTRNVTVNRQRQNSNCVSGGGNGNNVSAEASICSAVGTTTLGKPTKFHRNFLSMRSLNKRRNTSGGSSENTLLLMNKINGGSTNNVRNIKVESVISPGTSNSGCSGGGEGTIKMSRLKAAMDETYNDFGLDEEFNVSEGAYAAVADGNYNEETGEGEEEYTYAAYDESGDYQRDYEDPATMAQMEYQDDEGTIYEEEVDYPEGVELMERNTFGLIPNTSSSSAALVNGGGSMRSLRAIKKAQPRRVSLGTISVSPGGERGGGDQEGDLNLTKKCKVCHDDVPSYSLFNHVIATHYKGEVPTCSICKKTFTYKQGLISHMRYHDAEKYDKACSYCGKKFIRRSDVIIHERRLHTGERPYLCPVPDCNQGFVRRYCLLTHVKTNHGEPYMSQMVAEGRRKSS